MGLIDFSFDTAYLKHDAYDPDLWRGLYSMRRYLRDVSDMNLRRRYASILRNKASFSSERHMAHIPHNDWRSFWYWVRREQETEEEFKVRKIDVPEVTLGIPPEFRALNVTTLDAAPIYQERIVRFGEDRWLRSAFDDGQFMLKNAHQYADSGLNAARVDDELTASTFNPGCGVTITFPDGSRRRPLGQVTYQRTSLLESFILCAATEFDPWLFHDFQCDACLVIDEVDVFRDRIGAAIEKALPGFCGADFSVEYIDEHNSNPILTKYDDRSAIPIYRPLLTKSITYAYQKEYRFVWNAAPTSLPAPASIAIEAGSLRDISRYCRFDKAVGKLKSVL